MGVCRLTLLYRPYRALWRLIMREFVKGRLGFEKAPIGNGRIMSILILMLLFLSNPACRREHAIQTQKQRESERDACIHVIHILYIYICTHMYLSLSVFPIYIYKYIHIYIYIYNVYIHTYIHSYIHTYVVTLPPAPRSTVASSPLLYRFLFHICTQDSNVPKALQIPTQSCLSARAYKPRCYLSRA